MPLSGNDPAARSIAHMRHAERYALADEIPKSIAHFGRAMHYGATKQFQIRIDTYTGFLPYFMTQELKWEIDSQIKARIMRNSKLESIVQFDNQFEKKESKEGHHADVAISLVGINGQTLAIPEDAPERAQLEKEIREFIRYHEEWKIPKTKIQFTYS